ncbi:MAG: PAS domain S-box protein [Pyrinomonadaceae bacterium]|nr:PAS domain S-box protein [Phycisphaerales bacterium]
MSRAPPTVPSLESVLCTEELDRRPARAPDYEKEVRALGLLTKALADAPHTILQALSETIMGALGSDSAGVSMVMDDEKLYSWAGLAGVWKVHVGQGTPRDFSPAAEVIERGVPMLFRQFQRRYDYFQTVVPAVDEALLVPFFIHGKAVGTIWAVIHERPSAHRFDKEDLRVLLSLGAFASAAYQAVEAIRDRQDSQQSMREVNEALLISSVRMHELNEHIAKADAIVRESHARFEALFDASPVGMYLVDAELRIRLISRVARTVFGEAAEKGEGLIGRDLAEVIHVLWPPEVARDIIAHFRHTLETSEPYADPEFSEVRYDRHTREYYSWRILRIVLPNGEYGVVCYFLDISDRLLAERALRNSEIRYRRLFQSSKDGILILDANTRKIIDANAFMAGMLGQELSQLQGKELYEIGMFSDEGANKEAFRELQQNGYIRYDHLPVQKPSGELTHVEFVSSVYQEGDHLVAQCNVRDISARVAMEQQIARQTETLADQSHRKDEFLAMLSHELRNPLAPIRSAVYLLKSQDGTTASPLQKQACEIIERQVGNLTRLVSDLLEVSRVVSGRVRLDLKHVDLRTIVEHALQTAAPNIEQHRHTVSVVLCDEPALVSGDPVRLEEVVVNLLNNAAKYTPDGGRIEVLCELEAKKEFHKARDVAVLHVRDNGIGVDAELLPRIFDLFTQADRSLDRSAGGLGIGLSLAHRLVELHGGTIEVHSEGAGKGSDFVVKLPLITGIVTNASSARSGRTQIMSPDVAGHVRVLVVDDNKDLVWMLTSALKLKGYNVQSAYTGVDGLKIAMEWRPDVALLDIGLPGLDGYEVARRLRASPATSSIRLIAITGYGRDSDIILAQEAGFDAHLIKPYDFDDLEKLLAASGAHA